MIVTILRHAHPRQVAAAVLWTADNLHVPYQVVDEHVAVAYVCKHFQMGQLEGWDGFVKNIGG